jgi:methionyl aminopeptidase
LSKTPAQIDGMRKCGKLVRETLDMLDSVIKPGMSTLQINDLVHDYTIKHGAIPAPLNYKGFPKSVCTSVNNIVCHGIPSKDDILKDGDILNVDITSILGGFYADSNRMYTIGKPSDDAQKLIDVTKECLFIGIEQVKPYQRLNNIGDKIDEHATNHGFSVVRDLCGHGIGLQFHEEPEVVHYAQNEKGIIMLPGMTFTIEPMINAGGWKVKVLKDKWTVVTADNSLSAQWEHTVLVTDTGYEILT